MHDRRLRRPGGASVPVAEGGAGHDHVRRAVRGGLRAPPAARPLARGDDPHRLAHELVGVGPSVRRTALRGPLLGADGRGGLPVGALTRRDHPHRLAHQVIDVPRGRVRRAGPLARRDHPHGLLDLRRRVRVCTGRGPSRTAGVQAPPSSGRGAVLAPRTLARRDHSYGLDVLGFVGARHRRRAGLLGRGVRRAFRACVRGRVLLGDRRGRLVGLRLGRRTVVLPIGSRRLVRGGCGFGRGARG
ncbi:hypothetical protein, partial [Actinomadura sp. WAC 06369]|uniref:hypothetical protein n=1 Tax=Actinomadura sp. WAC 06369 TaxID=2203193 RepID=UPI001003D17F